ncbi:MAG: NAD-dependent epimerase/dehydratase family protein, partial [Cyclobacteriaceae bacterium]|nr:NAD-dependent epimerase/dehydratase family protein [Cyclobacteriaceae bacterium]
MQTILGATGIIGKETAKNLLNYTDRIRLVSRNPKKVNENDELITADLTVKEQVVAAVNGSDVVYLTTGLPYDLKVWQATWPVVMRNVIDACKKSNSRLVFFDNVYAYGKVDGWMTEKTPINPSSKKGEVRAKIADMLMTEVAKEGLEGMIVRAADFYGPDAPLSIVTITVFENLNRGKSAQWLINDKVKHSFTYTPDAGKATALLGNTDSAYNQIWHLPADRDVLTGEEFIMMAAEEFNTKPKYMVVKKW